MVRIGTYILFNMFGFLYLLIIFAIPIFAILSIFLRHFLNDENDFFIDFNFFMSPIIASPLACYYMAKIFKIFQIIDNLKISALKKILVVFSLSVANFLMTYLGIFIDKRFFDFKIIPFCAFGLIPAYFLYKYFNYLTIKYPIPFNRIGYYCSIEFFRDLDGKIRK